MSNKNLDQRSGNNYNVLRKITVSLLFFNEQLQLVHEIEMCCDAGTPSFCLLSFHLLKYSFSGYHGKLITHYGRSSVGDGTNYTRKVSGGFRGGKGGGG